MSIELTEALFSKAAGWEAMKRARTYLELDQVLSSNRSEEHTSELQSPC